jgi:hypothetical protein
MGISDRGKSLGSFGFYNKRRRVVWIIGESQFWVKSHVTTLYTVEHPPKDREKR